MYLEALSLIPETPTPGKRLGLTNSLHEVNQNVANGKMFQAEFIWEGR